MDPKREVALARSFAEKHLYPKMHAAQRVMMVPGTFACSNFSYMPLEQSEASVVTKLEGYEAWGNEDPYSRPDANPEAPSLRPSAPRSRLTPPPSGRRVAGMNPWHWRTRNKTQHKPPCDMRVGAGAMPKVVAKLKEIGSKIIAPH